MKKRVSRGIAAFMAVILILTGIPVTAFAEEEKGIGLSVRVTDGQYLEDGSFYICSDTATLSENEPGPYYLRILRYGSADTEQTVRLNMMDLTGKYGEDYEIRLTEAGLFGPKVRNAENSQSLQEMMSSEDVIEYNYSDAVISGEIKAEDQLTEEEESAEAERICQEIEEAFSEEAEENSTAAAEETEGAEETEVPAETAAAGGQQAGQGIAKAKNEDGADLSLEEAWSLQTGLENDKESMTYDGLSELFGVSLDSITGDSIDPYLSDGSLEIMEELQSAYLDIPFAEGESERVVEITLIDDEEYTGQLQSILSLTGVDGSVISEEYGDFTLFINDDEPEVADVVSFTDSEYAPENGYITVEMTRTGALSQIVRVMLDTESITAVPSVNFSEVHAEIYFLYGCSTRNIKIPVVSTGLTEDVQFKLKLQDPIGCEIGETAEALCTIHPEDESFEVLMRQNEEQELTIAGEGEETEEEVLTDDGEERKDIGIWDRIADSSAEITDMWSVGNGATGPGSSLREGKTWKLYSRAGFRSTEKSWVWFEVTSKADVKKHYEYKGFGINSKKKATTYMNDTWIYIRNAGDEQNIDSSDKKKWDRTDWYYIGAKDLDQVGVEIETQCWCKQEFWIRSIVPVKRVFQINLLESAPVDMIDINGNKVPNTDIDPYKYVNQTSLGNGGTSMNIVSGYHVTVSLPAGMTQMTYIQSLEMVEVGADGREKKATAFWEVSEKDGYPRTATFELTPKLLENYRDYYQIIKGGGDNNSYGKIYIRAVVKQIPVTIRVKNDNRVESVRLWDGSKWAEDGKAEGDSKVYTFGLGDYLKIKSALTDDTETEYFWSGYDVTYKTPEGKSLTDTWQRTNASEYVQRKLTAAEYDLSTAVTKNSNRLVVMVPVSEDQYFDHSTGIFISPVEKLGNYYRYVVDDVSAGIPGRQYDLTGALKTEYRSSFIPAWREAYSDTLYAQETYYYTGSNQVRKNVLYLSAQKNSKSTAYHLTGTAYYDNTVIGQEKTQTGWYPAEGIYACIDNGHLGVTDVDGVFRFNDVRAPEGYSVKIKLAAGEDNLRYVVVNLGKTADIDIGKHILVSNSLKHPHFTTLNAYGTNKAGEAKTYPISSITIANEDELIYTKLVANVYELDDNGDPFTYTYMLDGGVVTATEKVKRVEFVVIDGTTHKQKAVYKAELDKQTKEWIYEELFTRGHYSEYQGGDQMYARVITDRKVTNGTEIVFEETVYPITNTGLPFVDKAPVQPNKITIALPTYENYKLPLIGDLTVMLALKDISFGIAKAGNNGIRLYLGKSVFTQDSNFNEKGELKSDTGAVIGFGNFKKGFSDMVNRINTEGAKGMYQSATLGLSAWTITPMIGVYFEFAISKKSTGKIPFSFVYVSGGGFVGVDLLFRYTQYFSIMGIPTYVGGQVELTLLMELGAAKDKEMIIPYSANPFDQNFFDYMTKNTHFQYIFRAILCGDAYAGVGICNVLGVRGGFRLNIYFIHNPTIKKSYPDFRATGFAVDGNIQFWADALLLSIPIPTFSWMKTDQLKLGYFYDIDKYKAGEESEEDAVTPAFGEITAKPRPEEASEFIGEACPADSDLPVDAMNTNVQQRTIVSNAYDEASQKLITIDDTPGQRKVLMVYLEDDKEMPDAERTCLLYSVYCEDDGLWSEPKRVDPDAKTAELQPSLCDCGDEVLISWVSRKDQQPVQQTEGEYSEYLNTLEVYTARFDKESQKVIDGSVQQLTADAYMDANPKAFYMKDEDGNETVILTYLKSEVGKVYTTEELVKASIPQTNKAVLTYQVYEKKSGEAGAWKQDYYEEELPVTDAELAQQLQDALQGQRFVASPINDGDFSVNNPVVSDYDVAVAPVRSHTGKELLTAMCEKAGVSEADLNSGDKSVREKAKQDLETWKDDPANADAVKELEDKETESTVFGVYAFVAESDNQTSTTGDREVFVQLYDFENHTFGEPVRVTDNAKAESNLKLAGNGETTYLFWTSNAAAETTGGDRQSELRVLDISTLGEYDGIPDSQVVSPGRMEESVDGISISDYRVYVGDSGNMYIIWQESGNDSTMDEAGGSDMKQDLYMSALISGAIDTGNGTESVVSWSEPVCITNEKSVSGMPELAELTNGRILLISNNVEMDLGNTTGMLENAELKEYLVKPISIPMAEEILVSRGSDGDVDVSIIFKNKGLKPAEDFSYSIQLLVDGEPYGDTIEKNETDLMPGVQKNIELQLTLPDALLERKSALSLIISTESEGMHTESGFALFDPAPSYAFRNVELVQQGEEYCVTGAVENLSNADADENDLLQILDPDGNVLYERSLVNMTDGFCSFTGYIPITAQTTSSGYTDVLLRVVRGDVLCSEEESFRGYLDTPVGLALEGTVNGCLTVKKGSSVTLAGSFSQTMYLAEADIQYSVEDTRIASVSGNKLTANNAGITNLVMSVDPYGGSRTVTLKVVESTAEFVSSANIQKKGPADAVQLSGSWKQNSDGSWSFIRNDGKAAVGWGKTGSGNETEYFHFSENGIMDTGWFLNSDGNWYYLHEADDSRKGAMDRNWYYDAGDKKWYYLDPENGRMRVGWVLVNGKWYYLSQTSQGPAWVKNKLGIWQYSGTGRSYGSMYANETTPDGYKVDANGAWIQ